MTLLSGAVKIADQVTKALDMQVKGAQQVTHWRLTGDAGKGDPQYAKKKWDAVVDKKQRQVRTFSGELGVSNATVMFLGKPLPVIGQGDLIVLADKTGGPVMGVGGPVDASGQLLTEAYLG